MKKIFLLFITIITISCSNDEPLIEKIDYDAINETEIQEYLTKNNLEAEKSDSGLYYIINNEGTGNSPSFNSNVTVNYKGYLLNEEIFGEDDEVSFNLSQLIPGFSEGVQYIKEGGDITLIIPSKLAYKDVEKGSIPAGSVIIFEVTLLSIN
ncbi:MULTISPECIES: FKBP-type peptidyl-prolyl cis-trans isomerase [Tenacibaculum]|uniref:FKBP-type peptidyl-prolyl cis-trans isomerase n=1 Tax=Tenacibaculum TaxID=104267 RepID=UPI000EB4AF72|nr:MULTISPECIES: FKBP-type peptidyl-prolyl cis-trans isomerase [Tenacibaculum]NVK09373.1 FKBP-type peptidyl-prolyl cis-trans isomerase [Tenacibaculum sp.]